MRQRKGLKAIIAVVTVAVVVGLCCVVARLWYVEFVYKRTPEYVHANLTPPYEEEAEDFFYEHEAELIELAEMQEELDPDASYWYRFNTESNAESHVHDDRDTLPHEILSVLQRIESKTDCTYGVRISQDQIRVWVCTSTNFYVFLFRGDPNWPHSITGDEKTTPLEGGWTIEAPYTIRG